MIMVHGRGASAPDILGLAAELDAPVFAYLAPQAAGHTWYPNSFLASIQSNEPSLSSALGVLAGLEAQVLEAGIPLEAIFFLGFSQGACLVLEYAAQNARHFGGIIGLSGGLIGPEGTPWNYPGSLQGTPVFLGCSDVDPHIPKGRVLQSEEVFKRLGAEVTARLYPNMGHIVNYEERDIVRSMLKKAA
jgi:predicted esterase